VWAAADSLSRSAEGINICRTRVFVIALAFGPLIAGAGRTEDAAKDLAAILVSGQWVKDHGTPPLQDQHVYTFAKEGRY
jgi:hypothetical protein